MTMLAPPSYAGHRFPAEIISHAVWLYFRFPLSPRMVEEMLAARGIITDGCPGLRRILLDAGVAGLPILDWFHVAMRLQHLTQIAGGLSSDGPERAAAKAAIAAEVERLRWRLWNGRAKDAKVSVDRIRAVMHHFRGKPGSRRSIAPSRKLWTALRVLDGHLVGQSERLVDYGE